MSFIGNTFLSFDAPLKTLLKSSFVMLDFPVNLSQY
ncbi:hypothetical protein Rahaq2_3352 [Rahnella aquatilis CIP 78.65 = ATCC 33071]|uniref:Uncharacterized protein n=1 Tax=Rahnella aquatilis (strain ATCC 33071 / DSM 4594 / JCM 1683 / NBRC 105701 / NCIMB 13365 / CIP 78.65) TaxID=745277 RepID=H2IYU1_RAHAC|nr:hypothetical protein Rahaq2_3352 [Rahnella aquatilis CIP 78.65 = ATCC 33071]